MKSIQLTSEEWDSVARCVNATIEGLFIQEQVFHTLIGIWRDDARATFQQHATDRQGTYLNLANNSMNNLLGYPHKMYAELAEWTGLDRSEIKVLFLRFRDATDRASTTAYVSCLE